MTLRLWQRLFWLSLCLLVPSGSQAQDDDPLRQRRAYVAAGETILATYAKEQSGWNHYFTTTAPQQNTSDQLKSQETYRHFLETTLGNWRQLGAIPSCRDAHTLYDMALSSYSTAADFHLAFLHGKSALFAQKAMDFADERSRYYTTRGDEFFKQAVAQAQNDGCAQPPAAAP